MEIRKINFIFILFICIGIFFILGRFAGEREITNSLDLEWRDYWSCLDGCYNAQLPMNIHNKTLFDRCGEICYNRMVEDNRTNIEKW